MGGFGPALSAAGMETTMAGRADLTKGITVLSIQEQRDAWIELSENIEDEATYSCCLEEPCFYCIWKDPKHGAGADCTCEDDVLAGAHPCGGCIGEILEGHGRPALAPYFAKALAEEVGESHLLELKKIVEEKYNVPVAEQKG